MTYVPWPRKLVNFPIIMMPIMHQYAVAISLIFYPQAHMATNVHIIYEINLLPDELFPFLMMIAPTLAILAFWMRRKVETLILLLPLLLLLWVSAGGSFRAIWLGQFADGVKRPHSFILADQMPVILMAIFYTWAMGLILRYGEDE